MQAGRVDIMPMDDHQGDGNGVEFKGRFVLFPDQAVPGLNSPTAPAFHVQLRADPARPLYGLLCNADLPQRVDVMDQLRGFSLPGMVKVHDWGAVEWPGGGRRFVIIAERPGGQRVMTNINTPQPPLHEEDLVRGLLQPILSVLKDLQARGVVHRGIRPDNLFFSDGGRRAMMLGECVTAPPAYDQPALFEPAESAMCDPIARGTGSQANDLYSLGVTMLVLLMGRNPVGENVDMDRVILNKLEFGSYAALVGQARVPLALMEALRGMLSDDPKERWTLMDLDMWMSGRRLSPKQPKLPQRSSRPFAFRGEEFFTARSLGIAFARHHADSAAVIRSKALDSWLRRSLGDEPKADAMQAAVSANSGGGRTADDRLVARACIVLDPAAPIRYRGFNMMVEGLGTALAASQNDRDLRQAVSEIISSKLPAQWVGMQVKPRAEELRALQILEKLPQVIDQPSFGFGFERCLYELNGAENCHSPVFDGDFVADIGDVIPALDVAARRLDRPEMPVDRHIAAFIAARARRTNDEVLRQLNSHDSGISGMATLRLLATVQEQTNALPCPALCQWLVGRVSPALNRIHNRARRQAAIDQLRYAAEGGQLGRMLMTVDNQDLLLQDRAGFDEAFAEYANLDHTVSNFDATEPERRGEAQLLGEQISSTIAGILVSITTAIVVFFLFT